MIRLHELPIDDVILVRLMPTDENGEIQSKLARDFEGILSNTVPKARLQDALKAAYDGLVASGLLERHGRARIRITEAGRDRAAAYLGYTPSTAKPTWTRLRDVWLVTKALGLPPPHNAPVESALAKAEGIRAAIMWAHFDLPFETYPTLTRARDALLWRRLVSSDVAARLAERIDILTEKAFNQSTVIAELLNEMLDWKRDLDREQALTQLVAQIVGAKNAKPPELRNAILRAAVSFGENRKEPVVETAVAEPAVADRVDYDQFARAVKAAAAACTTGRFGDNEVFISHVWEHWRRGGPDRTYDLALFKEHLVEASRLRKLDLSRADMAYALDQNDVSASEIKRFDNTLHFIRLD